VKRKIKTQTIFENTGATKQDKKQAKTLVGVAARKKGKEWGIGARPALKVPSAYPFESLIPHSPINQEHWVIISPF